MEAESEAEEDLVVVQDDCGDGHLSLQNRDFVSIWRCTDPPSISLSCNSIERIALLSGGLSYPNVYTSSMGYMQVIFESHLHALASDDSSHGTGFLATWNTGTTAVSQAQFVCQSRPRPLLLQSRPRPLLLQRRPLPLLKHSAQPASIR